MERSEGGEQSGRRQQQQPWGRLTRLGAEEAEPHVLLLKREWTIGRKKGGTGCAVRDGGGPGSGLTACGGGLQEPGLGFSAAGGAAWRPLVPPSYMKRPVLLFTSLWCGSAYT